MAITIGVSGDAGSFSEQAAILYATQHNILDYKIANLINMDGVLAALTKYQIDTGVFAVINNNSGIVTDAFTAMGEYNFSFVDSINLIVEQCLIAKSRIELSQIKSVYSYAPAFKQCEGFLKSQLKHAKLIDYGDMAKAMRDLSSNKLKDNVAIIGPKAAANKFNLNVIAAGIEDNKPNITSFVIVTRLD